MKNMKKVLALLLALCMILALGACGGKEPAPVATPTPTSTPEPQPEKAENPVENTSWYFENMGFDFWDDMTFDLTDAYTGEVMASGTYEIDGDGIGIITIEDELIGFFMDDDGLNMEINEDEYEICSAGSPVDDLDDSENALLEGTWSYSQNSSTIDFDGDAYFTLETENDLIFGYYFFDGENVVIIDEDTGEVLEGHIDGDGDIDFPELDGWFTYEGSSSGSSGSSSTLGTLIGEPDSYSMEDVGDGKVRFTDYDRNVAFTCPNWMIIYGDGIGDNTDAVLVSDGDDGYVIGDNVSNEWRDYAGSDDDFLMEYVDFFVFDEFFEPLYGECDNYDYEVIDESNAANRLATVEGNYWNGEYDIYVKALLYMADDDIMVKIFFSDYEDAAQHDFLWNNVVSMTRP